MKTLRGFTFLFLLIFTFTLVSAVTQVDYFYGNGCPHCANVAENGILERVNESSQVEVTKYEIYNDQAGRDKLFEALDLVSVPQDSAGVPFALINCSGNYTYLMSDGPIINQLTNLTEVCKNAKEPQQVSSINSKAEKITLGGIIIAGLIDSINPCAFGVLLFLMMALLKMGSSKRALKAGLIYTFVVFVVYFLSGLGLFKIIQSFTSVTRFVALTIAIIVIGFGILELVDFVRKDKKSILGIHKSVKPIIEKYVQKGTIPALVVLGILVSLFELPCTGGIYLAILSMMSVNKTFGLGYLLIYNLIFVLPLIIITFLVYKGADPEKLNNWTQNEKGWMKLAAGLILLIIGIYLLLNMI